MRDFVAWQKQGLQFGFKGWGYGKFAKGIPCSYQFRGQTKRKK